MVFFQHRAQISDKFFHFLYKVRSNICLYPSDGVIVLYQSSSGGSFENIQNLLTVTESIEKCGQSTHVHTETGEEKQVRVYTLQFVHDGADVLHPFTHFHAHCLLNAHTEGMAVLVCAQIIQTVGQGQRLGVGEAFAHFFDAPVDVSAVHIQLLDNLTFQ